MVLLEVLVGGHAHTRSQHHDPRTARPRFKRHPGMTLLFGRSADGTLARSRTSDRTLGSVQPAARPSRDVRRTSDDGSSSARCIRTGTFSRRVAGHAGTYLWYVPAFVPLPRYAKRGRTDKCGTLSRCVPLSRCCDGAGQVGDIVVVEAAIAESTIRRTWRTLANLVRSFALVRRRSKERTGNDHRTASCRAKPASPNYKNVLRRRRRPCRDPRVRYGPHHRTLGTVSSMHWRTLRPARWAMSRSSRQASTRTIAVLCGDMRGIGGNCDARKEAVAMQNAKTNNSFLRRTTPQVDPPA
jgi:hypothetical protein